MSVIMNNGVPYMMVGGRLIQASILAGLGGIEREQSACRPTHPEETSHRASDWSPQGSVSGYPDGLPNSKPSGYPALVNSKSIPIPKKKPRKKQVKFDTDSEGEGTTGAGHDVSGDESPPPRRIPTEAETNKILKALGDLSQKYAKKRL